MEADAGLPILIDDAIFAKLVVFFLCPAPPAVPAAPAAARLAEAEERGLRGKEVRDRNVVVAPKDFLLFLFKLPDGVEKSSVSSSSSSVSEEMSERMLLLPRSDFVDLAVPGVWVLATVLGVGLCF